MWQGINASEATALEEENAQLRRQLAERQQLAALRGNADAPPQPDAVIGQQQRVLGLDGTWVERTWVKVSHANQSGA